MIKNTIKISRLILLVSALLCLNSCEWEGSDDENYVELEKPSETIQIAVDLAGVDANEIINVANGSYLYYSLSSQGKPLFDQRFYLDGVEKTTSYSDNGVQIYLPEVDDKVHEVKLLMIFKSGSGSLAERVGLERYQGEFTFKVKIYQPINNPVLNIKQGLEDGKYLKLTWNKPASNFNVGRYEIYDGWGSYPSDPIAVINDPNQTFFVDKTYNYGYKYYTIKAIPGNSVGISPIEEYIQIDYKIFNQDNIKATISDKGISLSWENPNPYPAKYVVRMYYPSSDKVVELGKNSVELPRPAFPFDASGEIYILPLDAKIEDFNSYPYVYVSISDKRLGEYSYHLQFLNKKTNTYIGLRDDEYYVHDLFNNLSLSQSGSLPNNIRVEYYSWAQKCSVAPNGLIAVEGSEYGGGNIHLFEGENFPKKLHTFQNLPSAYFTLSDKNLFYFDRNSRELCVIDLATKQETDRRAAKESYSENITLDVSSDGRYIILYSPSYQDSWYTIYELVGGKLKELRHVRDRIDLAKFNPQNASQLFLHDYANQFHIVDVASGNVSRTITNNKYLYTDPYTGNILCYSLTKDSDKAYFSIYDNTLTKLLYKVETQVYYPGRRGEFILANNVLIVGQIGIGNYVLDLSNSLKK